MSGMSVGSVRLFSLSCYPFTAKHTPGRVLFFFMFRERLFLVSKSGSVSLSCFLRPRVEPVSYLLVSVLVEQRGLTAVCVGRSSSRLQLLSCMHSRAGFCERLFTDSVG